MAVDRATFIILRCHINLLFAQSIRGGKTSGQIRVGLFWSFFAATPMMMLFGLVKGFLGSGTAENVVGFFWFIALSYFILCAVVRAKVGGAAQ